MGNRQELIAALRILIPAFFMAGGSVMLIFAKKLAAHWRRELDYQSLNIVNRRSILWQRSRSVESLQKELRFAGAIFMFLGLMICLKRI